MSDYQTARRVLGSRLRELRIDAGLSGRDLAAALGWPPSKISKLELGRQTPSPQDLEDWSRGCRAPGAAVDLLAQRRTMETHYTSWKRQLATGTRARQRSFGDIERESTLIQVFESACVPGLLQTPEYARHVLSRTIELHGAPDDVEEGLRARVQRQQILYDRHRHIEILLWEPALRMRICPPEVMLGQLDRIAGMVGMRDVHLGIVPTRRRISAVPTHGFWIFNASLVQAETIGAELRLVDDDAVAPYRKVFAELSRAALDGADAHRLLEQVRRDMV